MDEKIEVLIDAYYAGQQERRERDAAKRDRAVARLAADLDEDRPAAETVIDAVVRDLTKG
jgi:hypothetical protein